MAVFMCQDCGTEMIDEYYTVEDRQLCFPCAQLPGAPKWSTHYRGVHTLLGSKYKAYHATFDERKAARTKRILAQPATGKSPLIKDE